MFWKGDEDLKSTNLRFIAGKLNEDEFRLEICIGLSFIGFELFRISHVGLSQVEAFHREGVLHLDISFPKVILHFKMNWLHLLIQVDFEEVFDIFVDLNVTPYIRA
jgi:hypothetical protein